MSLLVVVEVCGEVLPLPFTAGFAMASVMRQLGLVVVLKLKIRKLSRNQVQRKPMPSPPGPQTPINRPARVLLINILQIEFLFACHGLLLLHELS